MHVIFTKCNQSSFSRDLPLQDCSINPVCIDKIILIKINLLRSGKTGKMPKKLPRELRSVWNTLSHQFICSKLEILLVLYSYYIHTEKYSPKSCVVNFRTQISSSQSEERTMVFTREKNDTSNQNRERCFFTCEKNDTSNQKPQRCVSFAPKCLPFIAACSAASHIFGRR